MYKNRNQDTESDQTNIEPPRKKHRMSLVSSAVNGRPLNQARQELITQSLSNMICVDMLPYNTVDHEGFRKFMSKSNYTSPVLFKLIHGQKVLGQKVRENIL